MRTYLRSTTLNYSRNVKRHANEFALHRVTRRNRMPSYYINAASISLPRHSRGNYMRKLRRNGYRPTNIPVDILRFYLEVIHTQAYNKLYRRVAIHHPYHFCIGLFPWSWAKGSPYQFVRFNSPRTRWNYIEIIHSKGSCLSREKCWLIVYYANKITSHNLLHFSRFSIKSKEWFCIKV